MLPLIMSLLSLLLMHNLDIIMQVFMDFMHAILLLLLKLQVL